MSHSSDEVGMPRVAKLIKFGVGVVFLIALVGVFVAERLGLEWLFITSVVVAIASGVGGMLFFMVGVASGAYSGTHAFQANEAQSGERTQYHIAGSEFVAGSGFSGDAGGGGD